MTNNEDQKISNSGNAKLTLGTGKLTLHNSALANKQTSIVSGKSTLVIEVKKGRALSMASSVNSSVSNSGMVEDKSDFHDNRISLLHRAQNEDDKRNLSGLRKLAEANQQNKHKLEEISKNIIDALPDRDFAILDPQEPTSTDSDSLKKLEQTAQNTILENTTDEVFTEKHVIKPKAKDTAEEIKDEEEDKAKYNDKVAIPKAKIIESKKLKKADLISMLDNEEELKIKTRSLASIKRARDKEKRKNEENKKQDKVYREVIIPEVITVIELANRMTERAADVTKELMKLGVMATSSQSIDADTAELIVSSFGHTSRRIQESDIENIFIDQQDNPDDLESRAPVVTVMGHVDHGKTSLLDALKSSDVASGETGGITQHIGAYSVQLSNNKTITFIDTPGHEAFSEMRTRGAKVTDIVVLVVAADDGIKAQTIEAISHAKAANVPIIVAINKIDKPDSDIDRVRQELLSHNLVPEEFGGDIITVPVSATKKLNIQKLEDAILLVAEMQELKANSKAQAAGVVIESRVDKRMGVVATVLVQKGILKKGDIVIADICHGRVRLLNNDKGKSMDFVGPSFAVEIYGLDYAPSSGEKFNIVPTEKQARDIVDYRIRKRKETKVTAAKTSLEEMFQKASGTSKIKTLPIILKGDVHGSVEAIIGSLSKIDNDEVKLKILHGAVGGITESDVTLAEATGAIIIGFNVRANALAQLQGDSNKVDIRYYSIIYNLIDDIKLIMSGMLSPIIRENYIGSVDIREVFNITKIGSIAGSYVTKGVIKRGAGVRLLRDNVVIHEGKLKTLKRFKDDVKEVREGFECGIAFENYEDIKIGDKVEVFEIVEEKKQL